MLVEVVILGLVVTAWKKSGNKGQISEEQEKIFINAMEHLTGPESPDKLRKLADSFDKQGLGVHASLLRKRADLKAISFNPERKAAQRAAYDKGMASTKPEAVDRLAEAFERQTATGAAKALREHAAELRVAALKRIDENKKIEVIQTNGAVPEDHAD